MFFSVKKNYIVVIWMRCFASLSVERVLRQGKGKIWLYYRRDDYFYIVHYSYEDFMENVIDDSNAIITFFRKVLGILGESDARIEWIARFWGKDARFVGFYCCYTSRNHTYGKSYIVLLLFDKEKVFSDDRLELCRRLEFMRKIWVYVP